MLAGSALAGSLIYQASLSPVQPDHPEASRHFASSLISVVSFERVVIPLILQSLLSASLYPAFDLTYSRSFAPFTAEKQLTLYQLAIDINQSSTIIKSSC